MKEKASKMLKWIQDNFLGMWSFVAALLLSALSVELACSLEQTANMKPLVGVLAGMYLFPRLKRLIDKLLAKLKK